MTPYYVGCDDGYAAIKLAWTGPGITGVKTMSIPSQAAVGVQMSDVNGKVENAYETEGTDYTVSKLLTSPVDTRFDGYPVSQLNRVLVQHALAKAGLGGQPIVLATGLPPSDYFSHSSSTVNNKALTNKMLNLRIPVRAKNGRPSAIPLRQTVGAQAVAAAIDYLVDDRIEMVRAFDRPIAVVDIGGRTTDCVYVVPGEETAFTIDHKRTASQKNVGILRAIDVVRAMVAEHHEIDAAQLGSLDEVLKTRRIHLFGKPNDVSMFVDRALHQVGEEILRFVERTIGRATEAQTVLFIGGGAEALPGLLKSYPHAVIVPDPQYANARGLLKVARTQVAG